MANMNMSVALAGHEGAVMEDGLDGLGTAKGFVETFSCHL